MRLSQLRVVGWTAFFLLALEVGLEFRAHHRGYDSVLFGPGRVQFVTPASVDGNEPSAFGPTDDFPFRAPIVPPTKARGVVRIWFGSASHGEDPAVSVPEIFPNAMGTLLEQFGGKVEVINASRAGLIINDNTRELLERGPVWHPDYAVLYGASMDLGVLSERFLRGGGQPDAEKGGVGDANGPAGAGGRGGELVSGPFRRLDKLYEETTVYAQLKSNVTTLITRQRLLADSLPAGARERFREEVERFVDAAEAVGAIPVLTTFATRYGWRGPEPPTLAAEKFMVRYNPYLKPSGWQREIHRFNDVIRTVASDRGVTLIELAPELTDEHQLFQDPVHFTPEGHARAAAVLAEGFTRAFGWAANGGGP